MDTETIIRIARALREIMNPHILFDSTATPASREDLLNQFQACIGFVFVFVLGGAGKVLIFSGFSNICWAFCIISLGQGFETSTPFATPLVLPEALWRLKKCCGRRCPRKPPRFWGDLAEASTVVGMMYALTLCYICSYMVLICFLFCICSFNVCCSNPIGGSGTTIWNSILQDSWRPWRSCDLTVTEFPWM